MNSIFVRTIGVLMFTAMALSCGATPPEQAESKEALGGPPLGTTTRRVIINRVPLSDSEIAQLENRFRTKMFDGAYWYDKITGAWGIEGGPTMGFVLQGINMGGPLRADASSGNTGVFMNGRELHWVDVQGLRRLGPVLPGRYRVDGFGNCFYERGPFIVNLVALARAKSSGSGSVYTGNGVLGFDQNGKGMAMFKDAVGNHHTYP